MFQFKKAFVSAGLIILLIVLLSPNSFSESRLFTTPIYQVKITRDIIYASIFPEKSQGALNGELLLDLYEPTGENLPPLKPALILAHGGSLKFGDRRMENISGLCQGMTSRGYVCVSIEYRLKGFVLPPENALAIASKDMAESLAWIVKNAGQYHIDLSKIAVGGFSAGASTANYLAYEYVGMKLPIKAVVALWGGMHPDRRAKLKSGPPLLIIQGTNDDQASYHAAVQLNEKMKEVKIPCQLIAVPGAGHNPPLNTVVDGLTLEQSIADFLCDKLNLSK